METSDTLDLKQYFPKKKNTISNKKSETLVNGTLMWNDEKLNFLIL